MQIFNYGSAVGKDPGEMAPAEVSRGIEQAVLASFW